MKKLFRTLAILSIPVSLFITSCTKEEDPTLDTRDKFVGTWTCSEKSNKDNSTSTFTISITKSGTASIDINNINNIGSKYSATATASGSIINISQQTVDVYSVSGSGNIANDKITLTYSVADGVSAAESFTATCTK